MSRKSSRKTEDEKPDEPQAATTPEGEMPEPVGEEASPPPEERVAAALAEAAAANDRYLRAKADLENFRKRAQRDLSEAREYVKSITIQEFFSAFDHFQMAMAHVEENPDVETMKQGMAMILAEFRRTFENLGIAFVNAEGAEFNPEEHEAVAQEYSDAVPAGTVIRQWKCGYRLGDKLLRPATVVVSGGSRAPQADGSDK